MIDERTLTDATRCPSCSETLAGPLSCPACGVDLSGQTARSLWQVSVQSAGLLAERSRLIGLLRAEAAPHPAAGPLVERGRPAGPDRPDRLVGPGARPAAPEWTRRKVQNLLLSLGAGLLAVAAVIFLVVSWSVLGIGGRAAVMAGCTVLAGGGAALAARRGLDSTAEAVSLLTVALGLLDAVGARGAGLAGLDSVDRLTYWAGALAVIAALTAAMSAVVRTRSLRVAAALLGQLPIPLATARLADGSAHPAAVSAAGLTLAAVAAAGLVAAWRTAWGARDARLVVAGGAGLAWLAGSAAALAAAYGESGSLAPGAALLLVLAGLAASPVLASGLLRQLGTLGVTASAPLVVAAAWAVPTDQMTTTWRPVVLSAVAGGLLAAGLLAPRAHRTPAALVALAAAVLPAVTAVVPTAAAVLGQLGWLDRPWQGTAGASAREMLAAGAGHTGFTFGWGTEVPLLLGCLAAVLLVAERLHAMRRVGLAAVPLVALAAITLPVALDTTFAVGLGLGVAVAAALVLLGARLVRQGPEVWGAVCAATGLGVLGTSLAWSLAVQSATLVTLPIAAVLLGGAAVVVGGQSRVAPVRLGHGVAAALLGVAEAAALARANGAGWPAVWSLALALCAVAAGAAALRLSGQVRRVAVVAATVSVLGEAAALTLWSGGSFASAGLAVTITAGALAAGMVWLDTLLAAAGHPSPGLPTVLRDDVALTAVVGGVVGVLLSAADPDRLWLALLAAGVAAAMVSLRVDLHRVGWAAGVLLVASSWVRLVLADVHAPEPYTVPAGIALVALGVLRRRRGPQPSSWSAYGTGLGLALGPSLVRAVSDPGNVRPMLLGLAALLVVCAGVARRLKAPLMIGGAVLGADALVQLSPYLVLFYAAVPRWSLLAGAGLLLLLLGMTYERRAQQLQAVHRAISRFD